MRHIKILAFALLSISARAQTQDTRLSLISGLTVVKIQPINVSIIDTTHAFGLGVRIVNDNLSNDCTLYYQLVDSLGHNLYQGNIDVIGADYNNWTGDNVYPFTYVAGKLKLTLK